MKDSWISQAAPYLIVSAVGGAAFGALGSLLMESILPAPQAGDGWSVRWILPDNSGVVRLEFGPDEKGALEKAIAMKAKQPKLDVAVIEVRGGRIQSIQKAGQEKVEAA